MAETTRPDLEGDALLLAEEAPAQTPAGARRVTAWASLACVALLSAAACAAVGWAYLGGAPRGPPPMPVWLAMQMKLPTAGGETGVSSPPGAEDEPLLGRPPKVTHMQGKGEEGCSSKDTHQACSAHHNLEGDMVLDPFQQSAMEVLKADRKVVRVAKRLLGRAKQAARRLIDDTPVYDPHDGAIELWPGGVVKYSFGDMNDECSEVMLKAMKEWEAKTCIRFEESAPGKGVVSYMSSENGCFASLGYSTHWTRELNMGTGCCSVGTAIHELGHTIGLRHEHNRPEAAEYIYFNYDNMDEWWKQWMEFADDWGDVSAGVPYDMASIMHYGPDAGCKSWGLETIGVKAKDVFGNCKVGQREYLSEGDILTVNRWYGCPDHFCADLHIGCEHWKAEGYCNRLYTEWMHANCPHSCEVCQCEDNSDYAVDCPGWADDGYCWKGHTGGAHDKEFMFQNCRKSCGNCMIEDARTCKDKPLWGNETGCKNKVNGVHGADTTLGWKGCEDSWFASICSETCGACPHDPFCT